MNINNPPSFLNVKEIALTWNCSQRLVRSFLKIKNIPLTQIEGELVVSSEIIRGFTEEFAQYHEAAKLKRNKKAVIRRKTEKATYQIALMLLPRQGDLGPISGLTNEQMLYLERKYGADFIKDMVSNPAVPGPIQQALREYFDIIPE